MSKILDNTTGAPINIADTGVTVDNVTNYTIPANDYWLWAASSDIITEIGAGNIVVNDGSNNLSISDGTDLIKGLFPSQVGVLGADGTPIGNVGDKMKVDASFSPSLIPAEKIAYFKLHLENAGANSLAVDGSTTNQVFSSGPGASEDWFIDSINLALNDSGNVTADRFGGIASGLTNGLEISIKINSIDYVIDTIKNNSDVIELFHDSSFRGTANSFINETNFFNGTHRFSEPVTLKGADSDLFKATIKDDLTGLELFHITIVGFKVVT